MQLGMPVRCRIVVVLSVCYLLHKLFGEGHDNEKSVVMSDILCNLMQGVTPQKNLKISWLQVQVFYSVAAICEHLVDSK